jgi:hypothetical protein
MELDETEEPKRDLKKMAKDVLEVGSDAVGLVSSVDILYLLVLMNALDVGSGFSSYKEKTPK